jgi:hypothetical protein
MERVVLGWVSLPEATACAGCGAQIPRGTRALYVQMPIPAPLPGHLGGFRFHSREHLVQWAKNWAGAPGRPADQREAFEELARRAAAVRPPYLRGASGVKPR